MFRSTWRLIAIVASAAVALAACSTSTPSQSELVGALRDSGIPAAEARCAVDAIFDTLSNKQIEDLYERGNGGTPKDDPNDNDDAATRLSAAMGTCRDTATTTSVPSEGPGGSVSPVPTTTAPGSTTEGTGGTTTTEGPAFSATDDSTTTSIPSGSNGLSADTTTSTAP